MRHFLTRNSASTIYNVVNLTPQILTSIETISVPFSEKTEEWFEELKETALEIKGLDWVSEVQPSNIQPLRIPEFKRRLEKRRWEWIQDIKQFVIDAVVGFLVLVMIVFALKRCFIIFIQLKWMREVSSNNIYQSTMYLFTFICIQILIGIFAVLYQVPIYMGVMHQIGAVLVYLSALRQFFLLNLCDVKLYQVPV